MDADNSEITKDFLEKILNSQIERFEVTPGSEIGDGYTCLLLSVAVWKTASPTTTQVPVSSKIIVKCYPPSASQQEFLDTTGIFLHELRTYNQIIPELNRFQEGSNVEKIVAPPFAKLIYGSYVNVEDRTKLGRPFSILDNSIVLPDLRAVENGRYRIRDRFLGLDLEHYSLVIQEQARLHAISWAYKQRQGIRFLADRFPFLDPSSRQKEKLKSLSSFVTTSVSNAKEMFQGQENILNAIEVLEERYLSVLGLYLGMELGQSEKGFTKDNIIKRPDPTDGVDEPWLVLLHGDAWSNNFMFRYDEKTGRAEHLIFIDLQKTREGDPLADIVYTLYCCTNQQFRSEHLTSILRLYYDTFSQVCKELSVSTLPGFTWQEFTRRFRRAKIHGAAFAVMCLPIDLKLPADLVELENVGTQGEDNNKKGVTDFFTSLAASSTSKNSLVERRLKEVLKDMIADDIL